MRLNLIPMRAQITNNKTANTLLVIVAVFMGSDQDRALCENECGSVPSLSVGTACHEMGITISSSRSFPFLRAWRI
eukprot:3673119-Amphidinium_carterae.1